MYICLCHGVSDSTIRMAVNNGARTFRQLSFMTGCGTQCGSCAVEAKSLFKECLESQELRENKLLLHHVFNTA
jgi:bacterioferritin-associated ferredoxin